jgi:hypothetical protein
MAVPFFYSPLNEDEDEIRLINLLAYAPRSSLLHCTLETISLKSLTTEYRNFMSISSLIGRKLAARWRNEQRSSSAETPGEAVMDKDNPSNSRHRFTWGDYAAMSYVWGDPGQTRPIILNGQEIQIQQNLEVALRTLSSHANFWEV